MTKTTIIKQMGLVAFPLPQDNRGIVDEPQVKPPNRKVSRPKVIPEMPFFTIAANPSLLYARWSAITFDFTHSKPRFNRQQIDYPLTYGAVNPTVNYATWSHDHLERRPRPAARQPIIPYDGWNFIPVRPPDVLPLPACVYTMDEALTRVSTNVEC